MSRLLEKTGAFMQSYFQLEERRSSIGQEFRAGTATFLTMSYILLVNPQLLAKLGVLPTDIVVSTALSAAIGSFIVGIFGNFPFGLASGVGLSAYLTYGLVLGEGLTLSEAFTSCFIAGVILLVLSAGGISHLIMSVIPHGVKIGTIMGMGLQIALVGMTSVDMVVTSDLTLVTMGDVDNYKIWLALLGLLVIGSLIHHRVKGGIVIGIFAISLLTWYAEASWPTKYAQLPSLTRSYSDFISFEDFQWVKCSGAIAAFVFIGIIDVSGVVFGMAKLANLCQPDDSVPGSSYCFLSVSVATIVGACMGSTPVIVYVESAAGIKEGGRSGLTAVVVGLYFVASLFLAPLFGSIPVTATAPVSILVGVLMMSQATEVDWEDLTEAIPAFLTMTLIPFTYSIANGIMFGLIAAILFYISNGKVFKDLQRAFPTGRQGYEAVGEQSELVLVPTNDPSPKGKERV